MESTYIVILQFRPDCDDSDMGDTIEVFSSQEKAEQFAIENYDFDTEGSTTGSATKKPDDSCDYEQSGVVEIYSSYIR